MSRRNDFMVDAAAALAAMVPSRQVKRGLHDPAVLGDDALRQGVFCLVAEGLGEWTNYTGREGDYGTLRFAVVGYIRVADDAATVDVEEAEAQLEEELLGFARAIKPEPLDAVYPKDCIYSRGLEAPVGWIVMSFEALYV